MHIRVAATTVHRAVVKGTVFIVDVTAYAGYRWTSYQQLIVYGAVRGVTNCTALAHRFMLEDKRTSLFLVALEAFFIPSQQTGT
jgi:hypothetical protein